ncbi:MAG TPA: PAS domain S-box protein [Chloroflexota bacterium]|nr:PAS domain S-box protein [Chloroflexota bacterium]HUM70481.1 PAS domain S-box protein [Chloroflexota bacterium]
MNQPVTEQSAFEAQLQQPMEALRQAEVQLQAERDFIGAILDSVDTLIIVLDRNGRILRFNRACETLTGYTFAEVKDQCFWDLLPVPEEKPLVTSIFARLFAGHYPIEGKNYWTTKDGRRRLISWHNTAVANANGAVEYVIGTGHDISERAQTALLINANENLQRATTALLQHLTTVDDVLRIVCAEALGLTGATGSAVSLLEEGEWLRVTGSSGKPVPIRERLPVETSFVGSVIKQGQPLLLNDPDGRMQAYHYNADLRTLLALPLRVDNTVLGVLDVVNKPGGFTAEDMEVMQLFAAQAAVSIEHAQLHHQAEKLAVLEERQRLARELHDSVTQALYSVTLYTDAARMALLAGKKDVATEHLQELRNMAHEAMLDMRLLIFELHPPVLEKEGLTTAVQTRLETVEARSGLQTALHIEGKEARLPLAMEEELYRIVQEALNNAVKHARAQQITVEFLYADNRFRLTVRDDGQGFVPIVARQSGGMGLRGIEERVQRIGGRLLVESTPDRGTTLTVEVIL